MITATDAYKTSCDDPQAIPEKVLVFNGTDYSDKCENFGAFSQRAYEGDAVTACDLSVELRNEAKALNSLVSVKTNVGKAATISLKRGADSITRYSGKLEEAEHLVRDRAIISLRFVGKLKAAIEQTLGSEAYSVDYYASAYNPADLAWELLTTRAGLDSTASSANTDIDYDTWLATKTMFAALGFSVKARFTGQTIAEGLRLLGYYTDSLVFQDPTGKVVFRKFVPTESASYYTFTDASAHIEKPGVRNNKARVINKVKAWYGYDPIAQTWAGSTTKENATSQSNYGIQGREWDSTVIWPADATSAGAAAERIVARYTDPAETLTFTAGAGTRAVIHQIGDIAKVTCDQYDYVGKKMMIYEVAGDLNGATEWNLLAEDLGQLNQDFFILDSVTNGVLDVNVLY